jgi:hypothetical protein
MLAAERKMSPAKAKDLAERFKAVFESVEEQLFPEGR